MLNLLAALGGSGSLMGGLGKALGSQGLANAGASNNVFGSLAAMFGGGETGGDSNGSGMGSNPMGDANMKLAQQAQQGAGNNNQQGPQVYQRKPVDLSNLMKILQQRAKLGIGGQQPGSGLGA